MKKLATEIEKQLLAIIQQFLIELGSDRAIKQLRHNASLTDDLGIGSLEKTELFDRIEKHFHISFPDYLLVEALTIKDLVNAIVQSNPVLQAGDKKIAYASHDLQLDVSKANTLIEVLELYAQEEPGRTHIYLRRDEGGELPITYGGLFHSANKVAASLYERGLKPGETVAIMLPTGEEFYHSFYGTLLAGGLPVPIYPPFRPDKLEEYAKREAAILRNAEVRFLITFPRAEGLSKILKNFVPSLKAVVTTETLMQSSGDFPRPNISTDDGAMIQYTSGSTGQPKGVLLSHANLLANIRAYGKAVGVQPTDMVVSWLPLYHDMGLIGKSFGSLYYGAPLALMSPLAFLSRPERWLWSIHYHRGTISAGPNFAYELCVKKIDKKAIEGLDLSSWRLAFNGAEAIYPNTLRRFIKKFAPYGFKPESLSPVYGLAESAVALTFPQQGVGLTVDKIKRHEFEQGGKAILAEKQDTDAIEFVSCGKAIPDHAVRVVDEDNEPVAERVMGSLQFQGPSAMQGYYRNPSLTQAIYHDGWWDTGDYAYIVDEEVYITGRKKDVIIKSGRNIYPAEVEELAALVDGVRKGCVAAFGVKDARSGTEKFVVVAETKERDLTVRDDIVRGINEKVSSVLGIPPDRIVLVAPGKVPKTSSGKLRRSTCKQLYIDKKLARYHIPAWFQVTRLAINSGIRKLWSMVASVGRFIYTIYGWIISLIFIPGTWIAVKVLPQSTVGRVTRQLMRWYYRFLLCPIKVTGLENIKKEKTLIFTPNHGSYIDSPVLMGILPADIAIVGKGELRTTPLIKTIIRKLGYLTVDRWDFSKSTDDAEKITQTLKAGRSVMIFPEGTFTYATGVRPFKLGAFKVAVDANVPICPIGIKGTRGIMRSGSKLIRPGFIRIDIGEPIYPNGDDWQEMIRLRNVVREDIAERCGEPTIDLITAGPQA